MRYFRLWKILDKEWSRWYQSGMYRHTHKHTHSPTLTHTLTHTHRHTHSHTHTHVDHQHFFSSCLYFTACLLCFGNALASSLLGFPPRLCPGPPQPVQDTKDANLQKLTQLVNKESNLIEKVPLLPHQLHLSHTSNQSLRVPSSR